jgi:hypothetical protein
MLSTMRQFTLYGKSRECVTLSHIHNQPRAGSIEQESEAIFNPDSGQYIDSSVQ